MGLKINTDIGVQGDSEIDILNDNNVSKGIKQIVSEVMANIEKPDFKSYLLSRNTYSFPYNLFMLSRSAVDTIKLRFKIPSKIHKLSESTKFIALTALPFSAIGIKERVHLLFTETLSNAKKTDSCLEIASEAANVFEGTGMLMEASVIILEEARVLLPLASALGIASTLVGLVNIVIDTRGIFKTTRTVAKIPARYKELKVAFVERFAFKNFAHALNILSTSVSFVAFSLVFFGSQPFLLAGGIVMTAGLGIGFGRMLLDIYSEQLFKERIYQIKTAAAA